MTVISYTLYIYIYIYIWINFFSPIEKDSKYQSYYVTTSVIYSSSMKSGLSFKPFTYLPFLSRYLSKPATSKAA